MTEITSTQNRTYKYIKSLKTKKSRMKYRCYTVEGIKSVSDAVSAGADIECIAVSDKLEQEFDFPVVYRIPDPIFAALCDTETPQGVLAVIKMPDFEKKEPQGNLYLYCDRVSDPGNIGTIIRICDAVNCGVILSEGSADIYNPKTVRSSMGSFFHTEIITEQNISCLENMKKRGYTVVASALHGKTVSYDEASYGERCVIVAGNEANGICSEILDMSDLCVKIPIWGKAESLNVGVASALLLYEARKQGFSS